MSEKKQVRIYQKTHYNNGNEGNINNMHSAVVRPRSTKARGHAVKVRRLSPAKARMRSTAVAAAVPTRSLRNAFAARARASMVAEEATQNEYANAVAEEAAVHKKYAHAAAEERKYASATLRNEHRHASAARVRHAAVATRKERSAAVERVRASAAAERAFSAEERSLRAASSAAEKAAVATSKAALAAREPVLKAHTMSVFAHITDHAITHISKMESNVTTQSSRIKAGKKDEWIEQCIKDFNKEDNRHIEIQSTQHPEYADYVRYMKNNIDEIRDTEEIKRRELLEEIYANAQKIRQAEQDRAHSSRKGGYTKHKSKRYSRRK